MLLLALTVGFATADSADAACRGRHLKGTWDVYWTTARGTLTCVVVMNRYGRVKTRRSACSGDGEHYRFRSPSRLRLGGVYLDARGVEGESTCAVSGVWRGTWPPGLWDSGTRDKEIIAQMIDDANRGLILGVTRDRKRRPGSGVGTIKAVKRH